MLPGSGVRNRHGKRVISAGMARLESVVADSALRFKKLPTRAKLILGLSMVFSISFYGLIAKSVLHNDLTDESYLQTDMCPACYGMSACGILFFDRVKFSGWSKLRVLDIVNLKNVHFAKHENTDVVLKKLAHNRELQEVDDWICSDGNRPPGCDVARTIYKSNTIQTVKKNPIQPKMLNKLSASMFTCASYRLLDRMWHYYKEKSKPTEIFFRDKVQLMYTSMVNSEPLILQTFPSSEGWPFPEYFGACGRFIMVQNTGRPLTDFYNAPFEKRADIAYQIMQMAEQLTNNEDKYALYWTDLAYENFSVDGVGKVTIIDAEHIFVVDKYAIEATKPKGWDELFESRFDDCDGKNCISFSTDKLCSHLSCDHNYYAACRNLLSKYAIEDGMPGGLLHDMPEVARDLWDLENLLNECTHPTKPQGRFKVKDKLIDALKNLRNLNPSNQGFENNVDKAMKG